MKLERAFVGGLIVVAGVLGVQNTRLHNQVSALQAQRELVMSHTETGGTNSALAERPMVFAPTNRSGFDVDRRRSKFGPSNQSQRERTGSMGGARFPGAGSQTTGGAEEASPGHRRHGGHEGRDWGAFRDDMEVGTVDAIEDLSSREDWSDETTDEVMAIMLDAHDEIGALWSVAREEDRSRYQTHREMREIRDSAGEELTELIGEESYEQLQEELWEIRHEVFRRTSSE